MLPGFETSVPPAEGPPVSPHCPSVDICVGSRGLHKSQGGWLYLRCYGNGTDSVCPSPAKQCGLLSGCYGNCDWIAGMLVSLEFQEGRGEAD